MQEWSERNVELCALRQRRIVADAWHCLKPGGVLIYSTCTYNHHENMDNLAWMASQYDLDFIPLTLDPAWGIAPLSKNSGIGYQCFPHRVRGEGFFLSVARKNNRISSRNPHTRSKLRAPAEKELGASREWVTDFDRARFFLHGQQVRFLPAQHEHHLLTALDNLHVIQAGTGVGEITKNKVVPDQALALSIRRNPTILQGISLSREQALTYLRREPLTLEGYGTGFHLVEYEGLGLGWVNVLPGRVNNLFPSGRRVRKTD